VANHPRLLVAAVAVMWGSVGVIVREVPLPAVAIVACRVWLAAAVLGAWLWFRHRSAGSRDGDRRVGGRGRRRPARTIAGGVVLAVHWVLFFAALKRAPIGTVLLLTYLAPVALAAVAPRALGERLSARTVVALAIAFAGLVLVARPALDGAEAAGVSMALGAAALYVVFVVLGKPLSEAYGGERLAFVQLVVAGVVLAPVAALAEWGPPRPSWAWLVPLGVLHTALGIGVFMWALARLPATELGVLSYLEPASAVLFGWALLSERPVAATVVGGALIVAAGLTVVLGGGARARGGSASVVDDEVDRVPR
jgi:DME family drug/metabolite transporter